MYPIIYYIALDRQVLDRGWPVRVTGPLCFHEFYSSDFHQVARFITRSVHTDGTGESPRCAIYSKILISSMS